VSPERELHELSVLPWRLTVVSFLVILAAGSAALPDATRLRVVGVGAAVGAGASCCWGRGRGLLAQVGLGRLLHGDAATSAHGAGRDESGAGGADGRGAVAKSSA
jgi:hypothetical protein